VRPRAFPLCALVIAAALALAMPAAARAAQPQRATLDVEGMTCSGCENTVESLLQSTPGVNAAKADRATQTVTVAYDGGATAPPTLIAAINENTYYRASMAGSPATAGPPPVPRQGTEAFWPILLLITAAAAGGLAVTAVRVRRRRGLG
jgi:copper chaperone CopZ